MEYILAFLILLVLIDFAPFIIRAFFTLILIIIGILAIPFIFVKKVFLKLTK